MFAENLHEVVRNLINVRDAVGVGPVLRSGGGNVADIEDCQAGSARKVGIVSIGNSQSRILIRLEIVAKVFRVKAVETEAKLIGRCRRESMVVSDRDIVISGCRVYVVDLDELRARRRRS